MTDRTPAICTAYYKCRSNQPMNNTNVIIGPRQKNQWTRDVLAWRTNSELSHWFVTIYPFDRQTFFLWPAIPQLEHRTSRLGFLELLSTEGHLPISQHYVPCCSTRSKNESLAHSPHIQAWLLLRWVGLNLPSIMSGLRLIRFGASPWADVSSMISPIPDAWILCSSPRPSLILLASEILGIASNILLIAASNDSGFESPNYTISSAVPVERGVAETCRLHRMTILLVQCMHFWSISALCDNLVFRFFPRRIGPL